MDKLSNQTNIPSGNQCEPSEIYMHPSGVALNMHTVNDDISALKPLLDYDLYVHPRD